DAITRLGLDSERADAKAGPILSPSVVVLLLPSRFCFPKRQMGQSLRRSCTACARFKHSCDRGTPSCSRCIKRKVLCVYVNQPLTASRTDSKQEDGKAVASSHEDSALTTYTFGSLDPFDSYPETRLPRARVQRLIYSFLHKIAFQYYPLDLNATSNPFLISWWPLALGDPALFHVSLQTACLDEELLAQKGFHTSEILMADSVALLRRKVVNPFLAVQDGTMNSVITLATIEPGASQFGKGNMDTSTMHVAGVKRMIDMRGGINAVRQTSPLTARMISWVSMLIMGHPQFETQDDAGIGDGIPPIPEWQLVSTTLQADILDLMSLGIDQEVMNVFTRLRNVFQRAQQILFPSTRLHDLTCFVIHRLLPSSPVGSNPQSSPINECIRYAIILYMFIIQGPTYYSHAVILKTIVCRFLDNLEQVASLFCVPDSLYVWLLSIGMVASDDPAHHQWYFERAQAAASSLQISTCDDALLHVKSVLWLDLLQTEDIFRAPWDAVIQASNRTALKELVEPILPTSSDAGSL
ncbi:uncharacterized protein N7459_005197, partial [Penicillium hispanicum]|uniref:uncharacterized protein n=1 Tax=Penicillium hispanicum TaxID=1080232 RepID=UPI0025417DD9